MPAFVTFDRWPATAREFVRILRALPAEAVVHVLDWDDTTVRYVVR